MVGQGMARGVPRRHHRSPFRRPFLLETVMSNRSYYETSNLSIYVLENEQNENDYIVWQIRELFSQLPEEDKEFLIKSLQEKS